MGLNRPGRQNCRDKKPPLAVFYFNRAFIYSSSVPGGGAGDRDLKPLL